MQRFSPGLRLVAPNTKVEPAMDVILHIGAHRTASTTFQHYMRANAPILRHKGVAFFGPLRTRHGGLLSGVVPGKQDARAERRQMLARGRIAIQLELLERKGIETLVISDENMLGNPRKCLREAGLYNDAETRLGHFARAFDGRVSRIVLSIRALDGFWTSTISHAVARGQAVPDEALLDQLVTQPRSWRDVIENTARAFPGTPIQVQTFEEFAARPERRLWHMAGKGFAPPMQEARAWLNRSPDLENLRKVVELREGSASGLPDGEGQWTPFKPHHTAAFNELYADDLFWLRAGAGGIATLTEEMQPDMGGFNRLGGAIGRGLDDDREDGRLAGAG